ncbi:hypothetical protein HanHA300_Chr11g0410591 [Helianthus annuus]|nr:hypothetical protein HanHA300_Chr11g0410591 [Helianthus annuus]KAJ0518167.1 hypothetical protein HanHA89_Chr11g0434271 [Helianthus annuus]KAJ0686196.1 hypothetical protein HanLR1_Chr11g0411901 [Helianthus annuus]
MHLLCKSYEVATCQVVTCGLVMILDLNHSMCSYWQKDTGASLTVHTTNKGIV